MGRPFTGATLFSGGGLAEIATCDLVEYSLAVEFDARIAAHYEHAWQRSCACADVCEVDYRPYRDIDHLHVSPSCRHASLANKDRGETAEDIAAGGAICRAIREMRPRVFTLENVPGYQSFSAYLSILATLENEGYRWDAAVYNAADYATPQTRRRLYVRAWRENAPLPPVVRTNASREEIAALGGQKCLFGDDLRPWNGWYGAIEDLIPTLPDSKFADWQLKRLGPMLDRMGDDWDSLMVAGQNANPTTDEPTARDGKDPIFAVAGSVWKGMPKALLVDGNGNRSRETTVRFADEPFVTAQAWHGRRPAHMPTAFLVSDQTGSNGAEAGRSPASAPAFSVRALSGGGEMPRAFMVPDGNMRAPIVDAESRAFSIESGADRVNAPRAVLVSNAKTEFGDGMREGWRPSFTTTPEQGGRLRALLEQGRVVKMTDHCLYRFQGVPDWYPRPQNRRLSAQIAGNGCAVQLQRAIVLPMLLHILGERLSR